MSVWPALKDVFTYKNLVHAVSGATGSSLAITVFYPLDAARTRVQVDDKRKSNYSPQLVLEIYEEEGLAGLYRGWFPMVTSICVSNFVYFYAFNGLKALAYGKDANPYPAKDLLLAFLAGATNVVTTTPLWVANTRLKLQGAKFKQNIEQNNVRKPTYLGTIDCLRKIIQLEGVSTLWSGMTPSILLASNPAVQFMVYEALKRRLKERTVHKQLAGYTYFIMGALAKMAATFATYPIQVIQSRLRAGHDKQGQGVTGMLHALDHVYRAAGLKGLYKGLEAKLTQTVLMAALMFFTYEKITSIVFHIMRQNYVKKTTV